MIFLALPDSFVLIPIVFSRKVKELVLIFMTLLWHILILIWYMVKLRSVEDYTELTNTGEVLTAELQPCISYPRFHFLVQVLRLLTLSQDAHQNHLQGIFSLFTPFLKAKFGEDSGKARTLHVVLSAWLLPLSWPQLLSPQFLNIFTLVLWDWHVPTSVFNQQRPTV